MQTIVIIGAGNVAYHFGTALKAKGKKILQIYNRSEVPAKQLADVLQTSFTSNLNEVNNNADLYLLAVSDSGIMELAKQLSFSGKTVAHVAGSVDLAVLSPISENTGVLYPVQSLSKQMERNFSEVPLCIEASNNQTLEKLSQLANELSSTVVYLNSQQRKNLHLAAVFASNFGNCLNVIVTEMLLKNQIPLNIIQPLVLETAKKFGYENLKELQTGPAIRNDQATLQNHLNMLEQQPDYKELYKLFTRIIQKALSGGVNSEKGIVKKNSR